MKRVEIDFVPHSQPKPWMWKAMGGMWVAALMLFALAWQQRFEAANLRAELERLRAENSAAPKSVPAPAPPPPPYEASARQMLLEKTSPWRDALRALEAVEMPGVQIVALEISTPEKRVRVEVQFNDLGQLLKYLNELNLGEPTPRWSLEQTAASGDRGGTATGVLVGSLVR